MGRSVGTESGAIGPVHDHLCRSRTGSAWGPPYPFRFVSFTRTDGLPILSVAMWWLGVVVGAGVVLFNAVGLVGVSAMRGLCHAEQETRRGLGL